MQTVKIIREGSQYKVGDILVVYNNDAFSLIDKGYGELYKPSFKKATKKPMTVKKYSTK